MNALETPGQYGWNATPAHRRRVEEEAARIRAGRRATATVAAAPHTPIRREGARPSPMHAALPSQSGWLTACGERLQDSSRGIIRVVPLETAWAMIREDSPDICRRCARVGESVE